MGHKEHKAEYPTHVVCGVITVSDTRTPETDKSGRLIQDLLLGEGHQVGDYQIVPDEAPRIRGALEGLASKNNVQAVILTGGTGVSQRDGTVEVVEALLEKELKGFGELFRYLSYGEIGSSAMLSRALAGVSAGKIIFCLPGSSAAVRLGMEKLILPELGHLVGEIAR